MISGLVPTYGIMLVRPRTDLERITPASVTNSLGKILQRVSVFGYKKNYHFELHHFEAVFSGDLVKFLINLR